LEKQTEIAVPRGRSRISGVARYVNHQVQKSKTKCVTKEFNRMKLNIWEPHSLITCHYTSATNNTKLQLFIAIIPLHVLWTTDV